MVNHYNVIIEHNNRATQKGENKMKTREETLHRLRHALASLAMDYMDDLKTAELERAIARTKEENGEPFCMIMTGENNAKVVLSTMKDIKKGIECMTKLKDDEIANWQLAGLNAIFDQCNADHEIPYDLGVAVCGILGIDCWDE